MSHCAVEIINSTYFIRTSWGLNELTQFFAHVDSWCPSQVSSWLALFKIEKLMWQSVIVEMSVRVSAMTYKNMREEHTCWFRVRKAGQWSAEREGHEASFCKWWEYSISCLLLWVLWMYTAVIFQMIYTWVQIIVYKLFLIKISKG